MKPKTYQSSIWPYVFHARVLPDYDNGTGLSDSDKEQPWTVIGLRTRSLRGAAAVARDATHLGASVPLYVQVRGHGILKVLPLDSGPNASEVLHVTRGGSYRGGQR